MSLAVLEILENVFCSRFTTTQNPHTTKFHIDGVARSVWQRIEVIQFVRIDWKCSFLLVKWLYCAPHSFVRTRIHTQTPFCWWNDKIYCACGIQIMWLPMKLTRALCKKSICCIFMRLSWFKTKITICFKTKIIARFAIQPYRWTRTGLQKRELLHQKWRTSCSKRFLASVDYT